MVLTYTLSGPAMVAATVLGLTGRPVRSVVPGRAAPAGLQTHTWEATDDSGRPLPNGTYLVEVTAVADDGQQVRAVRPVTVMR
jgi:flagellar hook assembly protein FlgD